MTTTRFLVLVVLVTAPRLVAGEPESIELIVRETAGLRRFGYPIHVTLTLPRAIDKRDNFRLLADGKPIEAQVRIVGDRTIAIDWNASPGPLEKATYTVEYGDKVPAGPEPRAGMTLEQNKDRVTVRSGGMVYTMNPRLLGLFDEVRDAKKTFVPVGKSSGLRLRPRGRASAPIRAADMKIVRQGPLACGLRWAHENGAIRGTVEMTFPRSKSWVEVLWTISGGDVEEMGADLSLSLEGSPVLADFGAGSMVYTTLKKDEVAHLQAGTNVRSGWAVLSGKTDGLRPFVSPVPGKASKAEGWAHLMDARRCTAVAVADFGSRAEDRIALTGAGTMTVARRFAADDKKPRTLRFWLHFVDAPVHVGALTSPQAMMAPLKVTIGVK